MRDGAVAAVALMVALAGALDGCAGGADEDPPRTTAPASSRSGSPAPPAVIELTIRYDEGTGAAVRSTLLCRDGEQRATGALASGAPVAELCVRARSLAGLLTTSPAANRACTQLYGGPQTARVTGTIDSRRVDRRFARTDGCEIADFSRAADLLQP
jgi:hypothetical protein